MNPTARRMPLAEETWKRILVLLIAGVALLGAVVGFLQVDAGARAARYSRDARAAMLRSVAKSSSAIVRYAYERERLAAYYALGAEWLIERDRAVAAAAAAASAEAAAHAKSANRLFEAMEAGRSMSTLLTAPYFDEATFAADVVQFNVDYFTVPSLLASEQDEALRAQSTVWGEKAERYIVTLTVLAVSLFLFGLATTLHGGLRRLFAIVGSSITAALVAFAVATALAAAPAVPNESLTYYADAAGDLTYASYVAPVGKSGVAVERATRAVDLATQAIDLRPDYAAAFELRAMARLLAAEQSPAPTSAAGFGAAVADFDRAIALGRDSGSLEDLRARALFFAGRTNDALVAARRALVLSPEQGLRFGLHLAILLLGAGKEDEARREAEAALVWSQGHSLGSDPVTFREAVLILDRLAPLGWPGREALETRIKEAFVSLTHLGVTTPLPLTARLNSLAFSATAGGEARASFPAGTQTVAMSFEASGLAVGALLVVQVSRDGIEQTSLGWAEVLSSPTTGTVQRTIGARGGKTVFDLVPGAYAVEVYVSGALALRGAFTVE